MNFIAHILIFILMVPTSSFARDIFSLEEIEANIPVDKLRRFKDDFKLNRDSRVIQFGSGYLKGFNWIVKQSEVQSCTKASKEAFKTAAIERKNRIDNNSSRISEKFATGHFEGLVEGFRQFIRACNAPPVESPTDPQQPDQGGSRP